MADWQPIETAPKDGTKFLAVTASGQIEVDWREVNKQGSWTPSNSQFWHERPKDRYTHWMPLPAPPEKVNG